MVYVEQLPALAPELTKEKLIESLSKLEYSNTCVSLTEGQQLCYPDGGGQLPVQVLANISSVVIGAIGGFFVDDQGLLQLTAPYSPSEEVKESLVSGERATKYAPIYQLPLETGNYWGRVGQPTTEGLTLEEAITRYPTHPVSFGAYGSGQRPGLPYVVSYGHIVGRQSGGFGGMVYSTYKDALHRQSPNRETKTWTPPFEVDLFPKYKALLES